jgi:hypothetical protein
MEPPEVPIPEVPTIADATIVRHPTSERDCLLATTEDGERVAFGFEVESDRPGLVRVDPGLWLTAAETGAPEKSPLRFDAVEDAMADDWLQAIVAHPVGSEWLQAIKQEHPDAHHEWFAQTDYDEGGEEGAG